MSESVESAVCDVWAYRRIAVKEVWAGGSVGRERRVGRRKACRVRDVPCVVREWVSGVGLGDWRGGGGWRAGLTVRRPREMVPTNLERKMVGRDILVMADARGSSGWKHWDGEAGVVVCCCGCE